MTTQYYTGCSLDGFIADPERSLSWLVTRDIDREGPMAYDAFMADVGAMAMGATTYQWILDNDPGPWGYQIPCWVFTHREFPEPDGDVRFTTDDVGTVHEQMTPRPGARTSGWSAEVTWSGSSMMRACWTRSGCSTRPSRSVPARPSCRGGWS